MDIVIPLRPGAPKNFIELKYSLRSLEKFFSILEDGEVFLLGEEHPDWFRGGWVNLEQPKKLSQISGVQWKLLQFAKSYRGGELCFSNDDILLLKPWFGTRYFNSRRNIQSPFHNTTVERARFLLEQAGSQLVHDYELHVPIVYDTRCLCDVMGTYDLSVPTALRTLYCNLLPIDCGGIADCKMMNWMKPDMKAKFFSSDDCFAPRRDFHDWLQQTFPAKSRWEK